MTSAAEISSPGTVSSPWPWAAWTYRACAQAHGQEPVSYTHLDVYKRQAQGGARCSFSTISIGRGRHRPDALKDFSGRTTEMTDYLAEQIVADLPEELREFLSLIHI